MRKPLALAVVLGLALALVPVSIALAHATLLQAVPTPKSVSSKGSLTE